MRRHKKDGIAILFYAFLSVILLSCGGSGGGGSNSDSGSTVTPSSGTGTSGGTGTPTGGSNPTNSAPIANAGLGQTVNRGDTVFLDGTGSVDPDGDLLSFQWAITSMPNGSTATISAADTPFPYFTVDQNGNYIIQLIVVDSKGLASSPSTVTVSTINSAPVADAGLDQSVTSLGTTVALGGQSYDLDGDLITYSWSITSMPAGSSATISDPASPTPTFVADVQGDYIVFLAVTDTFGTSNTDSVTISFTTPRAVTG